MTVSPGFVLIAVACLLLYVLLSFELAARYTDLPPVRVLTRAHRQQARKPLGVLEVAVTVFVLAASQWVMLVSVVDQGRPGGGAGHAMIALTELVLAGVWTIWLWRSARAAQ